MPSNIELNPSFVGITVSTVISYSVSFTKPDIVNGESLLGGLVATTVLVPFVFAVAI